MAENEIACEAAEVIVHAIGGLIDKEKNLQKRKAQGDAPQGEDGLQLASGALCQPWGNDGGEHIESTHHIHEPQEASSLCGERNGEQALYHPIGVCLAMQVIVEHIE